MHKSFYKQLQSPSCSSFGHTITNYLQTILHVLVDWKKAENTISKNILLCYISGKFLVVSIVHSLVMATKADKSGPPIQDNRSVHMFPLTTNQGQYNRKFREVKLQLN